ncbi:HAD superfamily hydrolase (TIGR01509 family) [Micromonospora pisi]|uniref:HAD superfamily hydrolase (TIGR01509 family) n=1 Tax=Micromonospora pisi TaxID=589240 RepID=A0A495JW62_9ACTN|nr:HAD superfamily hydrolase (TIGR01509 family) [Micromonospora pisi]
MQAGLAAGDPGAVRPQTRWTGSKAPRCRIGIARPHRTCRGSDGAAFLDRWLGGNVQLNQALLDVIPCLGVERVYLASDQGSRRGAYVEQLYQGQRWLDGAFLSHRVSHRKPDPRYFDHILRTVDRAPTECLFVDDNAACVAAATAVGTAGIQFVDALSLTSELAARGLPL